MAREHLVESFFLSKKDFKKIDLKESDNKLLIEGIEYNPSAVYRFKIWRLNELNLNNRIYTTELANYVMKNSPIFTYGLVDHPEEDGSFGKIWAIEKNPLILKDEDGKDCLYVDFYLVGDYGKGLIQDILNVPEAGVGLSSSAYGEVNPRTKEVMIDGFEIERWADAVLNPSYEVYGFGKDKVNEKVKESLKEVNNEDRTNTSINNNELSKEEDINKEVKTMTNKKPVEEKVIRLNIQNLIKEADAKKSIEEKLVSFNELLEWFEGDYANDLKESVLTKISELNEKVKEFAKKGQMTDSLLSEKKNLTESVEELTENYKSLSKKYDIASEMLEGLKIFANRMKGLYENQKAVANGMVKADELVESLNKIEDLEKTLSEATSNLNKLLSENSSLKKNLLESTTSLNKELKLKEVAKLQLEAEIDYEKEQKDKEDLEKKEAEEEKVADDKIEEANNSYKFNQTQAVVDYYMDLEESNPNFVKIRNEILKCKTLFEAQKTALNLKEMVEGNYIPERTMLSERKVTEKTRHSLKEESQLGSITSINRNKGWI